MADHDIADEEHIGKYADDSALASAITRNLFDTEHAASESERCPEHHVIRQYMKNNPQQPVNRKHTALSDLISNQPKKMRQNGKTVQPDQRFTTVNSPNGPAGRPDVDFTWLDEPQTLYLTKKLHVQDSLAFVDNLARVLSSTCVLHAMKKMKLVHDLTISTDNARYPVFAIDCHGKVIAWNKAMEQITTVPAHEMIGKGDHAYAVPFYGAPRPMLIDYLVLPFPHAEDDRGDRMIGTRDVLSSKEETVWLRGRPQIIWGRGTRIRDEDGITVGAVQSIGIRDPVPVGARSVRQEPPSGLPPVFDETLLSSLPPCEISSPYSPERAADHSWTDIGLPAGKIQVWGSDGQFLYRRHDDLRTALRQLMVNEGGPVRNPGAISLDSCLLTQVVQGTQTSDNLFEHVIKDAREGIIAYDKSLRCILWNTFMEQLTGIPAAEVIGKPAVDMVPALKDAGAYLLLEQALSGKTVESSDISCHFPISGKQSWVRLVFSALRGTNGDITGIIGIVQDTTARKVMEYALQTTILQLMESEEKYRSVFNSKNDPLILIDTSTHGILDLNNALADLYGYTREEFFALSLSDLFTEPETYSLLLERQAPGSRMCLQRKKDGTIFPADVSYAYFDLKGRLVLILSIRDQSASYQTADALRLANTKLNLLIGVTRHDVINNLTVLMGYNDLLKHTVRDPTILAMLTKEESALQAIHRQIEFTREYYNLGVKSPLWQNICETATRAYSHFITPVAFTCDTPDIEIYADPLLEKVFYNLFDNAIRHGESISHVRIYCVREDPDLLLIFGDDGQGILPENKEQIFKRGFGKHTGLGLFLTREILAITRIEIRETGEFEKGARFELRIPAGLYRFSDSSNPFKVSGPETTNQQA